MRNEGLMKRISDDERSSQLATSNRTTDISTPKRPTKRFTDPDALVDVAASSKHNITDQDSFKRILLPKIISDIATTTKSTETTTPKKLSLSKRISDVATQKRSKQSTEASTPKKLSLSKRISDAAITRAHGRLSVAAAAHTTTTTTAATATATTITVVAATATAATASPPPLQPKLPQLQQQQPTSSSSILTHNSQDNRRKTTNKKLKSKSVDYTLFDKINTPSNNNDQHNNTNTNTNIIIIDSVDSGNSTRDDFLNIVVLHTDIYKDNPSGGGGGADDNSFQPDLDINKNNSKYASPKFTDDAQYQTGTNSGGEKNGDRRARPRPLAPELIAGTKSPNHSKSMSDNNNIKDLDRLRKNSKNSGRSGTIHEPTRDELFTVSNPDRFIPHRNTLDTDMISSKRIKPSHFIITQSLDNNLSPSTVSSEHIGEQLVGMDPNIATQNHIMSKVYRRTYSQIEKSTRNNPTVGEVLCGIESIGNDPAAGEILCGVESIGTSQNTSPRNSPSHSPSRDRHVVVGQEQSPRKSFSKSSSQKTFNIRPIQSFKSKFNQLSKQANNANNNTSNNSQHVYDSRDVPVPQSPHPSVVNSGLLSPKSPRSLSLTPMRVVRSSIGEGLLDTQDSTRLNQVSVIMNPQAQSVTTTSYPLPITANVPPPPSVTGGARASLIGMTNSPSGSATRLSKIGATVGTMKVPVDLLNSAPSAMTSLPGGSRSSAKTFSRKDPSKDPLASYRSRSNNDEKTYDHENLIKSYDKMNDTSKGNGSEIDHDQPGSAIDHGHRHNINNGNNININSNNQDDNKRNDSNNDDPIVTATSTTTTSIAISSTTTTASSTTDNQYHIKNSNNRTDNDFITADRNASGSSNNSLNRVNFKDITETVTSTPASNHNEAGDIFNRPRLFSELLEKSVDTDNALALSSKSLHTKSPWTSLRFEANKRISEPFSDSECFYMGGQQRLNRISRTPVRDSLAKLEEKQHIISSPKRSSKVLTASNIRPMQSMGIRVRFRKSRFSTSADWMAFRRDSEFVKQSILAEFLQLDSKVCLGNWYDLRMDDTEIRAPYWQLYAMRHAALKKEIADLYVVLGCMVVCRSKLTRAEFASFFLWWSMFTKFVKILLYDSESTVCFPEIIQLHIFVPFSLSADERVQRKTNLLRKIHEIDILDNIESINQILGKQNMLFRFFEMIDEFAVILASELRIRETAIPEMLTRSYGSRLNSAMKVLDLSDIEKKTAQILLKASSLACCKAEVATLVFRGFPKTDSGTQKLEEWKTRNLSVLQRLSINTWRKKYEISHYVFVEKFLELAKYPSRCIEVEI